MDVISDFVLSALVVFLHPMEISCLKVCLWCTVLEYEWCLELSTTHARQDSPGQKKK